jgi:hypothetical protein
MTAQTTRAILFAMATLATRTGFLVSSATSRGSAVSGLYLARRINDVAPITRIIGWSLLNTRTAG